MFDIQQRRGGRLAVAIDHRHAVAVNLELVSEAGGHGRFADPAVEILHRDGCERVERVAGSGPFCSARLIPPNIAAAAALLLRAPALRSARFSCAASPQKAMLCEIADLREHRWKKTANPRLPFARTESNLAAQPMRYPGALA